MSKEITTEVVEAALAAFPKAKRNAVVNVCSWLPAGQMSMQDYINIRQDERLYSWPSQTFSAIQWAAMEQLKRNKQESLEQLAKDKKAGFKHVRTSRHRLM